MIRSASAWRRLSRLVSRLDRLMKCVPDASATRFATYLEAHANPRRTPNRSGAGVVDGANGAGATAHDPVARLALLRRLAHDDVLVALEVVAFAREATERAGDVSRLRLLTCLQQGEWCVSEAGTRDNLHYHAGRPMSGCHAAPVLS